MIVDLSRPYFAGMPVYPGDPSVELTEEKQAARDGYTAYFLRAGLHAGTHLDAPLHMIAGGEGISTLPLSRFMAPGVLLSDTRTPPAREIPLGAAVLIETGMDGLYGDAAYYTRHPVISGALCEYLVERRAALVGLDAPSPDRYPFPVHRRLLGAGIPLLENLTNLAALRGKAFTLIALPLPIAAEASPVRAAALVAEGSGAKEGDA